MKRPFSFLSSVAALSIIVAACNMGKTPPPAAPPEAVQPPALTEAPIDVPPTELVIADLAGPPMEVGSKYLYIDGSILAAVPGGPFIMGYSYSDNPKREVTVGDFWIYTTEVTNQQYALCVNNSKCTPPNLVDNPAYDNYRFVNNPVVGVNHQQASDYCTFVHGRLPTEAEWEKAARGPEGNIFPWGNSAPDCDLLNFDFCKGKTVNVKSYPDGVSFYGLFDMSGNIREWVADWYKNDYYKDAASAIDPLGAEFGQKRSIRSSSFADSADFAIAAHRFSLVPQETLPDLGFRCVVDDPTYFAPMCEQLAFLGSGPSGATSDCTPEIYCNNVGVGVSELPCHPGDVSAYSNVNFSVDAAPYDGLTNKDAPGCVVNPGDDMQYTCQQGVAGSPATISGMCYDLNSCTPVCAAHYVLDGDICKWDGSGTTGTECLPDMTYDPVSQCCSATPGSAVDYNACPDGTTLVGGLCVVGAPPLNSDSEPITFDLCEGDPGDDDGGDCPPPQTWVCTPNPICSQYPTNCPYPPTCSCQ